VKRRGSNDQFSRYAAALLSDRLATLGIVDSLAGIPGRVLNLHSNDTGCSGENDLRRGLCGRHKANSRLFRLFLGASDYLERPGADISGPVRRSEVSYV